MKSLVENSSCAKRCCVEFFLKSHPGVPVSALRSSVMEFIMKSRPSFLVSERTKPEI